jgi:hypothetical protein
MPAREKTDNAGDHQRLARGRRALVTGGHKGAGAAIAGRLIAEIARLIVGCETPYSSAISAWTRFLRKYVRLTVSAFRNPRIGGHLRIPGASSRASILAHSSSIPALVNPVVLYMSGDLPLFD